MSPRTALRRLAPSAILVLLTILPLARAQDTRFAPKGQLIPPPDCFTIKGAWEGGYTPCTGDTLKTWLDDITHWRNERRIRIGYDPHRYETPAMQWTQTSFFQPQMMVQDRYFYDPAAHKYTVDKYLNDLETRYGGIDSVLIWPTYPNMGIDNRNQHDLIRCMPGGIPGVKQMIADFHKRNVRVLFPMMMWDQGTRDPGQPWPQAIAELMKEIGADGINGDTQDGVPAAFPNAADRSGHPLVYEPENTPADEAVAWNLMTWGQYNGQYTFAPGVDRYRWLEPRHMVHISDRWDRSKTDNLQFAFFNGEGWESWENIWGIWNGITPRDSEATRRVSTIEHAIAPFLVSQHWQPFYPTHRFGVFASRWPLKTDTAFTIVNRNEYDVTGRQLSLPHAEGTRYFDLYHGIELQPEHDGSSSVLSFPIEAHGFGAILATSQPLTKPLESLMATMKSFTSRPLASYSAEWKQLPQQQVAIAPTKPSSEPSADMVKISGGDYLFKVEGIEIEGVNWIGLDVQYAWEDMPRRFHEHRMQVKPFSMDKYPVTNAAFKKFVDATHYRPIDALNFLKDWHNGTFPPGWDNKPVTWVSLEDARAYAQWAGKRLPHEWEWQFAAQGTDGRLYPWGNDWKPSAVPVPDRERTLRPPDNVNAHPEGDSPFGIADLVGNVWQWTDEYTDDHTRSGILRGGCYYKPQGSLWYFPQAYRNDQHGKLLLMAPSYDRAGTLGFRCVRDSE